MDKKKERKGMVYFIHGVGTERIKIGFSEDVKRRLSEIQSLAPLEFRLLKSIEGDQGLEKKLHDFFSPIRSKGEWFWDCSVLRDFIRNVTDDNASDLLRRYTVTAKSRLEKDDKIVSACYTYDQVERLYFEIGNLKAELEQKQERYMILYKEYCVLVSALEPLKEQQGKIKEQQQKIEHYEQQLEGFQKNYASLDSRTFSETKSKLFYRVIRRLILR